MKTEEPWVVIWAIPKNNIDVPCWLMVKHVERGWELPGGTQLENEGNDVTALRELFEETGLLGVAISEDDSIIKGGVVVLVEIDEEVIKVSKTFLQEIGSEAWSDKRLAIHIDDGVKWVEKTKDNFYDVIFIDCSDPSEFSNLLFTDSFYKECKRILTKKGILATQSESPESFENIHIHILKSLNKIFKLSETMYSFVPIYPSGIWSWTFASDEELNLSKVNYKEVMEIENNCDVWNLNFQNAAFKMMPNKIVKELNS